jgi:hypothetical protein
MHERAGSSDTLVIASALIFSPHPSAFSPVSDGRRLRGCRVAGDMASRRSRVSRSK